MNKYFKIAIVALSFLWFSQEGIAQCFPDQIVTAAYATGGTSPYKDKVLWLTWGSTNQQTHPYGRHNRPLSIGSKSYASIHLGGDMYLCIEAEITAITGGEVDSYAPGNFSGDSLDKLYNVGGIGTANQLVAGIINRAPNGATSTLTLKAKATINGVPIRIAGLVVADGESLAAREYIYSTARGTWNIVDIRKNIGQSSYNISKNNPTGNSQEIKFESGNDKNTGAVAFLAFNETAYAANDFSVDFTTTLKGGGKTALAIGLLTPNADLGDAPESYGAPIHLIQNLNVTSDGIIPGQPATNINTTSYNSGQLLVFEGKHLGTKAPDADNGPMHSRNALGDDISPLGNPLIDEEDAWPSAYRTFSYKANYMPGNIIEASIAYKNADVGDKISGWIDFDLNGKFDENERQTAQVPSAGNGSVTLTWEVPATRVPYNTYVRLRYFDHSEDPESPVGNVNFGEVEDHRIYILTPGRTNPMLPNKSEIKN